MEYWDIVNNIGKVFEKRSSLTHGKSYGMTKYMEQSDLDEGVAANIQQAALDFLSTEFKGIPMHMIQRDLEHRTDELYDKWERYAQMVHGINSVAGIQTGWEMIIGGKYGDPGLVKFPKRGVHHQ